MKGNTGESDKHSRNERKVVVLFLSFINMSISLNWIAIEFVLVDKYPT